MLFIKEELSSKLLSNINPSGNFENIFVKINLRSRNWLILDVFNPSIGLIQNLTLSMSKNLDSCLSRYEDLIV